MLVQEFLMQHRKSFEAIEKNVLEKTVEYQEVLDHTEGLRVNQFVDAYSLDLSFAGDSKLLQEVFKRILALGFRLTSDRPEAKQSYWSGWFRKEFPDSERDSVRLYIQFTSTKCRRQQVGTKMEEVPVYDTVCDEESETTES